MTRKNKTKGAARARKAKHGGRYAAHRRIVERKQPGAATVERQADRLAAAEPKLEQPTPAQSVALDGDATAAAQQLERLKEELDPGRRFRQLKDELTQLDRLKADLDPSQKFRRLKDELRELEEAKTAAQFALTLQAELGLPAVISAAEQLREMTCLKASFPHQAIAQSIAEIRAVEELASVDRFDVTKPFRVLSEELRR